MTSRSVYKGAQAAFLIYDVTKVDSFNNVLKWLAELRQYADPEIKTILIGNKSDL